MSILEYLIKVNLAVVLFGALFGIGFRNLTFFQWNRIYLPGSVLLSFILPLFRLPVQGARGTMADMGGIDWAYMDHLAASPLYGTAHPAFWSPGKALLILYLLVALSLLVRSFLRILRLHKNSSGSRLIHGGKIRVYVQEKQRGSFTLFRRIYLDRVSYEKNLRSVLRHEMVHAVQLHSLDLLFMELVIALLWFNPFVLVLSGFVRDNHEYLADYYARSGTNSLKEYLECLRAESVRHFSPVPASYFKRSNIKRRIIMLTNRTSKQRKRWRYLGIFPLMALILVFLHSPAEQSRAGSVLQTGGILAPDKPVPLIKEAPSQFPLPEMFRDHITWGYNQEAIHPISGKLTTHHGIDIAAPTGTPVYAAAGGLVKKAESEEGWGNLVVLEHQGGYTTFYAHLDEIKVEAGTSVDRGEVIGSVGNTGQSSGPHLHYEVRKEGEPVDPANFY